MSSFNLQSASIRFGAPPPGSACKFNAKEAIRYFERRGFQSDNGRGTHVTLTKAGLRRPLVLSEKGKDAVSKNTMASNARTLGIPLGTLCNAIERDHDLREIGLVTIA